MSSLPTPNWALNEAHLISQGVFDSKTLEEGTFARPLALEYVPDYIKETKEHKHFNPEKEVYCYTHIGIVAIPIRKLSKI